jgi:hypothetical protein
MLIRKIYKADKLEGWRIPLNFLVEYENEVVGRIAYVEFLPNFDVELAFNIDDNIANYVPFEDLWLVDIERGVKCKIKC